MYSFGAGFWTTPEQRSQKKLQIKFLPGTKSIFGHVVSGKHAEVDQEKVALVEKNETSKQL